MEPERNFVNGHAVGQFDGGFNLFGERFGSEIAPERPTRIPPCRAPGRKNAGHRNDAFQSAWIERQDFTGPGPVLHKNLAVASLGMGPTPAMA